MARLTWVALISALLVFACTSDHARQIVGVAASLDTLSPPPVATVDVTPSSASVEVHQTVQLTATPKDSAGTPLAGRTISWASSDTAVANVDTTGLVTGTAPGLATITATSEGKSGSASITVTEPPPVATVDVTPPSASVEVHQTVQLTATPKDSAGTPLAGRTISWTSSDTTVAHVDTTGLVTGTAPGLATITATSEGKSGSASITVTEPPPPAPRDTNVACAIAGLLDTPGRVWCWGANERGQLGNGTTGNSSTPVSISSTLNFGDLAAGDRFTCGLAGIAGSVWCWGANERGQLGTGNTIDSRVPVQIANGAIFHTIGAGPNFACAIAGNVDTPGPIWCWGANESGQLGNGSTSQSNVPVAIATSATFGDVDVGPNFACGHTGLSGPVWCWGAGESGQLGNGTTTSSSVPVRISSTLSFNTLAVGSNFACGIVGALDKDGPVWCWGANESGQLGNGTITNSSVPVRIASSLTFSTLVAGPNFICGIVGRVDAAGQVWCWGANASGQLGNGATANSSVPVRISSSLLFGAVTAGPNFACAYQGTGGPAWCWGANESGQLGNGTTTSSSVPVAVSSGIAFGDINAGPHFVCGFGGTAGQVWCWGANESGQLGNGTTTDSSVPVPISSSLNYWVIALTP
jgi:alpha-tubulin suppressor-like RCC1 family protein